MRTVYIAYPTSSPVSTLSSSSRSSSSLQRSSSSYSCTLFPKKNNFYNIELYGSGILPTGYSTEHKLIIYKDLGSGVHSGIYETPYLPYSGVIASITTELPESTKFEVKTIYKDKNVYLKGGDYLDVQILNLVDINYSNRFGLDLFKKEAIRGFNELFCCTDKCYVGFIKFAGKNQVEKFDFSNNKEQVYNYISGLSGVYKYNPGSSINEALALAQTFTWKKEALKIINFITNNKPYIERTSYECYKSDIDFPSFVESEIDDLFLNFNLIKNTNKDIKINVFFIDEIGIETKLLNIISSSSSSNKILPPSPNVKSSSSRPLALPSLFISGSDSSISCLCDINVEKTISECDPCCGIKDAYEDGYKYQDLTDPDTLERVCCPPCPEGYYRKNNFYNTIEKCANCIPAPSSSTSSSLKSTSSSSKSWLIRSSSSSLSLIKKSPNTSSTSLTANCFHLSDEEKCCDKYNKCGSSMISIRCSSESRCSCTLSSADCPKPCPCSIDDYGITVNHDLDTKEGTCGQGPECIGWWLEVEMSDVKYTKKFLSNSNGDSFDNPDYICYKAPLSNTVDLKLCKRDNTFCPNKEGILLHPNKLGLTLNWVILNLCDGRNVFNQIFWTILEPCKAYERLGKRVIKRFWQSCCILNGAYGYKVRYWITWNGGILNNKIKEFEHKFGKPIPCTSDSPIDWSTFPDKKCCCSSSSSTSSNSSGGSGGSSTGAVVGHSILLEANNRVIITR